MALFWIACAIMLAACLRRTDGKFIYGLDDAYIHMSVAKNLAANGTWGVSAHEFSTPTSSLLWPLLLSPTYAVIGPWEPLSLVFNILCGTAMIALIWAILRDRGLRPWTGFGLLVSIAFVVPAIPVAFLGMEHLLQTCLNLGFVYVTCESLADGAPPSRCRWYMRAAIVLAPLVTMIRYEGLVLVAVASVLFWIRKRGGVALLVGLLGVLPIVVAGSIFRSKGWFFLPASVALKGNTPDFSSWVQTVKFFCTGQHLVRSPHLAVLLAAVPLLLWWRGGKMLSQSSSLMGVMFLLVALFQIQFGRVGEFFRYEAHLVCLGLVSAICLALEVPWRSLGWQRLTPWVRYCGLALGGLCFAVPLLGMGVFGNVRTPKASACVYQQQYQMARFLRHYYDHDSIAANDIGAIDYFTDVHCLDLAGLGNLQVARLKLAHQYGAKQMCSLARERKVKAIVVYSWWFSSIPPEWIKAGQWTIPENVICGGDTVAFYAAGPVQWHMLRRQLEEFSPRLPQGIKVVLEDQPPRLGKVGNSSCHSPSFTLFQP